MTHGQELLMGAAILWLGIVGAVMGWWLGPHPQPLTFYAAQERKPQEWTRAVVQWIWHHVTMEQTRQDAATMNFQIGQVFALVGILGFSVDCVLALFRVPWMVLVIILLALVILIPNTLIRRRFARWQRRVVAGLPAFLQNLQLLLDLGMPLLTAIQVARSRIGGPLGQSLDRVLFDINRGKPVGEAFDAMAARTRRMETLVLAAILKTTAGHRLSGKSLEPLMMMLKSIQTREEERISISIDQTVSAIPILATFGAMIMGIYLLLAKTLGGLHGISF